MKRSSTRILALLISLTFILCCVQPVFAAESSKLSGDVVTVLSDESVTAVNNKNYSFGGEDAVFQSGKVNDAGTASYTIYTNGDLIISGSGSINYSIFTSELSDVGLELKRIIINEGITAINGVFYTNEEPITVDLPNSLEYIMEDSFYFCNISQLYIPANVRELHAESLYIPGLTRFIVAPENLYYSNDDYGVLFNKDKTEMLAYPACAPLSSYTVPEGVIALNDNLFCNAQNLTTVNVAQSVRKLGVDVFGIGQLQNSYTENGVVYLGDIAVCMDVESFPEDAKLSFKQGTRLICSCDLGFYDATDVYIPDSVVGIGNNVFTSNKFGTAEIPASVEYIGNNTFRTSYYSVDENNRFYSNDDLGVLFNKDGSRLDRFPVKVKANSYTVPKTVKVIGEYAFNSAKLRFISLPEGLEVIEKSAFESSSIWSIKVPESVRTIGEKAFLRSNLTDIIIPENVEFLGANAINGIQSVAILSKRCVINPADKLDSLAESIIIGYDGSTAQDFAINNSYQFISITGEHKHVFFPSWQEEYPSCTKGGIRVYACPCGNSQSYTNTVSALGHDLYYNYTERRGYCDFCDYDITSDFGNECECICHSINPARQFIYSILRFFWKLFGIKSVCECGIEHY